MSAMRVLPMAEGRCGAAVALGVAPNARAGLGPRRRGRGTCGGAGRISHPPCPILVSGRRGASSSSHACAASKPWRENDARLVLENGAVFPGYSFGHTSSEVYLAEVVFNTSLTGYQEILTDPSYHGQMVCFTQPHIGNVGINEGDMECEKGCHLRGVVCRHLSETVSNYRSVETLDEYLKRQEVVGIAGVDTRQHTRQLRDTGSLVGVVCTDASKTDAELAEMASSWSILGKDLLKEVTCKEPYQWRDETEEEWEFQAIVGGGSDTVATSKAGDLKVVAYDFGIKSNILKRLSSRGCDVTVVPADYPWEEVMKMEPDGVFFSNGPGDPSAAPYAVDNAKNIIGKLPCFGICMGHQILGQAFGGTTFKLKFGHHGGNHPIKNTLTDAIEISAQNHNFAVDPATLPDSVQVTHVNLNDGTGERGATKTSSSTPTAWRLTSSSFLSLSPPVAGMVSKELNVLTIQYHPEASPGPHDADVAFDQFVQMMKEGKGVLEPKIDLTGYGV